MRDVVRKPIKRKAIKLPMQVKMALKLQEVQGLTKEDDILSIIEHYNMLARNVLKKGGYNAVSIKDPTRHKNWTHFEYVYEICRLKGWDAKLYIEAQFARAKMWNANIGYPPPNTLHSDRAIMSMSNYLSTIKQKYEKDVGGHKKERGKITQTLRQQIVSGIVSSADGLDMYLRNSRVDDKAQHKAIRIFQSWGELSPFYLWSVPWFHKALNELPQDNKKVVEYKEEFNRIHGSKTMQEIIQVTVQTVEEKLSIPHNIEL